MKLTKIIYTITNWEDYVDEETASVVRAGAIVIAILFLLGLATIGAMKLWQP